MTETRDKKCRGVRFRTMLVVLPPTITEKSCGAVHATALATTRAEGGDDVPFIVIGNVDEEEEEEDADKIRTNGIPPSAADAFIKFSETRFFHCGINGSFSEVEVVELEVEDVFDDKEDECSATT
eukprot:PhM_4_TR17012/c0_g1_i3/m.96666